MEIIKMGSTATIHTIPEESPKPNFRKDIRSILLLFLLYILQGIPLGLILTVPFLLQSKGVPYKDQARFSLAFWPFSLKVLYAPIVDAIYWKRLGRRKSWLIPLQYLIAIFLFTLAFTVEELFDSVNVPALTAMFFMLNFLAASQDVAVDGWALTMLSPENVAYASTCNAVGQTLGFVTGYSGFLVLDSVNFANKFRSEPQEYGLVTLPQFLLFWAIIFAITTTLILIFKKEKKESAEVDEQHMDIFASYQNLWKILKLRNIRILAVFLLTVRIGMAAIDSMSRLKLVEVGIPKETLAFFSIPLIPVKLILPILISKWIVGDSPMRLYINTIPFTLCFGVIYPLLIFALPSFKSEDEGGGGSYPTWIYFFLFGIFTLELIPGYIRFVSAMGFAAKVSDPAIGGTYMTLINTITNVGGTWPSTVALWLVDYVGIKIRDCLDANTTMNTTVAGAGRSFFNESDIIGFLADEGNNESMINSTESGDYIVADGMADQIAYNETASDDEGMGAALLTAAAAAASKCVEKFDGFYVESIFCVSIGILWLFWGRPTILRLQARPRNSWKVVK